MNSEQYGRAKQARLDVLRASETIGELLEELEPEDLQERYDGTWLTVDGGQASQWATLLRAYGSINNVVAILGSIKREDNDQRISDRDYRSGARIW